MIQAPAANAIVAGNVPFSAHASDLGGSGMHKVRLWIGATYLGYDQTPPYAWTVNTGAYPNGRHTIKFQALDRAGNSTTKTVTVTVMNPDTTPPSVAITAPAEGADVSGTVTLSADASDAEGMQKVRFWADGVYLGYDSTAPYTRSWNSAASADGPAEIRAEAVDWADHATTQIIMVNVQN